MGSKVPKFDARTRLLDPMYTTAFALHYSLGTAVLLILLCVVWLWQRRKQLDGIRSRFFADDIRQDDPRDTKHSWDIEQHGKKLTEGKTWFSKSVPHWRTTYREESSPAGIWEPSLTSGQLANLVQGRNQQKKTLRSRAHLYQDQASSQRSCLLSSPWSPDAEEHCRIKETDLIEVYYDSDLHEVWKRRLMNFVGPKS